MAASLELGKVPTTLGELPSKMKAVVIRPDRFGPPSQSMKIEEVDLPPVGATEVLVLVMAAGVNFNGVWAAQGKPVNIMKYTGYDFHIAGSDASGIVWKVGSEVRNWKVGDEVILHCNQACGQCATCNGLDPMACEEQKIWGYETNWGSFAQFTKVQAQQLLRKPKHLTWEAAASYGLTFFTAYRMLFTRAKIQPGQWVLVWGAAGGLGAFAVQLCRLAGANAIGVVSSADKMDMVKELGAAGAINRKDFKFPNGIAKTSDEKSAESKAMRAFGAKVREFTGGRDVDVVFEHVGQETFPTSVFCVKKFGKVVICGATSGYELNFDVRYLWMRQKDILGSHFANAYECSQANELVIQKKILPTLDQTFKFEETPLAHQLMMENKHKGKMAILVQAPGTGQGAKA